MAQQATGLRAVEARLPAPSRPIWRVGNSASSLAFECGIHIQRRRKVPRPVARTAGPNLVKRDLSRSTCNGPRPGDTFNAATSFMPIASSLVWSKA